MDKEHIKKLAEKPEFISGIHNYCDRWCERCKFTSRCMNFALTEDYFGDSQTHDINNAAFWQTLSEIFRVTREMVEETAAQQGIDIESLDTQTALEQDCALDNIAKNHLCSCTAETYAKMVEDWFDSKKSLFEQKQDNLNLKVQLELPDSDPFKEADEIKDTLDVIRWYQHQIYIKLLRAVRGDLPEDPPELDDFPKDSDGSAKVALIAIDRSIAAWGQMYKHFPEHTNDILDILVHLDRLRRKTETTFPNARAFVRPGFDEIHTSDIR